MQIEDKRIIVTGACGTVGSEMVRQLLQGFQVRELVAVDHNESELFFLEQQYQNYLNSRFYIADIKDLDTMTRLMQGVDIVFHTAAYKHVVLCERSPFEAVQNNIIGVQNIISAAKAAGVETVVFTSSDKAVNPTNVMGTSKLMGERLMTAAHCSDHVGKTKFLSCRFGNVMGSHGSVIPIFREQISKGGPVTLTDPAMTRFIMSVKQAVQLVIDSASLACGGEVFVTKMPVIRIKDLAEVMIDACAADYGYNPESIKTVVIGAKPGEKFYEELMTQEETRRTVELPDYFIVKPAFSSYYNNIDYVYDSTISGKIKAPYNSSNVFPMSKMELAYFLRENSLLSTGYGKFKPDSRYWGDEKHLKDMG